MNITSEMYVSYLNEVYELLKRKEEYITELDSATGDGDHWANMNMGFAKINELSPELVELNLTNLMKKIGTTMMAVIGGSSGVLYGGAYLAAAKTVVNKESLETEDLYEVLNAMLQDIMTRGKSEPGWKTMVDGLYPAVVQLKASIEAGDKETVLLEKVRQASIDGAEATKEMEAIRGRATYQANKGVGHLDPGAVTMSYQIATLCDTILKDKE